MTRTNAPAALVADTAPRLVTRDGVEVSIDATFTQPHLTRVRFGDDANVVLPAEMLQRQADGTLQIPLTASELAAAAGQEAVIPVVEEKISVSKRS